MLYEHNYSFAVITVKRLHFTTDFFVQSYVQWLSHHKLLWSSMRIGMVVVQCCQRRKYGKALESIRALSAKCIFFRCQMQLKNQARRFSQKERRWRKNINIYAMQEKCYYKRSSKQQLYRKNIIEFKAIFKILLEIQRSSFKVFSSDLVIISFFYYHLYICPQCFLNN